MNATGRFTNRAEAYVVGRPSYPLEAVDAILAGLGDPSALVVADIGAGTGISSRLIASRGPQVVAVEPNAAMREAATPDPRVRWVEGTAEATSLPAASVDVAAALQAWHWVDHALASAELRRIVRPGGRLAIAYNERDETDAFTAAYGAIVRRFAQDDTEARRAVAREGFASIDPARTRFTDVTHVQRLERTGVHKRAESTSYLPHEGPAYDALHAEIDALLDRFGGETFGMALVTHVTCVDV